MKVSRFDQAYVAAFQPEQYLAECFPEPDSEYFFTIRFMIKVLRALPADLRVLEFGGGPTLYSVAALTPHAREIHFCDYVPANLDYVRQWLVNDPKAFSWQPYLKILLAEEGIDATPAAVGQREAEMRRKVSQVTRCDGLAPTPLGPQAGQYDLVVAHHCTDVAAATVAEWKQILRHVSTLVVPGGWLLVSVTTGSQLNTVGAEVFPCVDLTAEDIYQGYMTAGYDGDTLHLETIPVTGGREYSGAISAFAQKLIGPPS